MSYLRWTATALGEQPSICSVKQGIQVPSTVSFAPAFEFKTHQVPTHYTKGGWPVKNSGLRLSVGCLGVVAAFVWAGGVGRLNKKLSRQIYLPLFACILSLSVACIVYDANSLLSVNTSQCPSGELYSIVNSFKGYDCSCHTGAIFWATLGKLKVYNWFFLSMMALQRLGLCYIVVFYFMCSCIVDGYGYKYKYAYTHIDT